VTLPLTAPLAILLCALGLTACGAAPKTAGAATQPRAAFIRLNLVGYGPGDPKRALLMSPTARAGTFEVVDASSGAVALRGRLGRRLGRWSNGYPFEYPIVFSGLSRSGSYRVQARGASSPVFRVGAPSALYGPLVTNGLYFFASQRDGSEVNSSVLDRQPSHLADQRATVYATPTSARALSHGQFRKVGGPVDVSGGWFDAGDYLKFVETASFTDDLLLLAARDHPDTAVAAEGRYGADWLGRMWDARTRTLYYQVGIGDGDDQHVLADHDLWRLPEADDALNVTRASAKYFVKYRPVFRAGPPGSRISPNLAGRMAAAFGLCAQVFHASDPAYAYHCLIEGQTVYDLAKTTHVGTLLTTAPHSFYPEDEWRDDMELGATELYRATSLDWHGAALPHSSGAFYLRRAARWGDAYMRSPHAGEDSLNLYDVGGLADYELSRAIDQAAAAHQLDVTTLDVTRGDLLGDLRDQLRLGEQLARRDPFRSANPNGVRDSVSHAIGYAIEARAYDSLTGTRKYARFGAEERDWVLGANAWGTSFVVGAGSTFPRCLHDQIANLSGSLNGSPPILLGATVNGPTEPADLRERDLPSGARRCPTSGGNPYARFNGRGAAYEDNVGTFASSEPSDDHSALALFLFDVEAGGGL
jgi:endoglucanase